MNNRLTPRDSFLKISQGFYKTLRQQYLFISFLNTNNSDILSERLQRFVQNHSPETNLHKRRLWKIKTHATIAAAARAGGRARGAFSFR